MHIRDVPCLAFSILITAVASCQTIVDDGLATIEPEWVEPTAGAERPLPATVPPPQTPAAEPPPPSPMPTASDWQTLGGPRAGLALAVPQQWVNLTDRLGAPAMDNRLGLNLLFAADTERTGRSLLAGKSFADGAYISGLVVAPPAAAAGSATGADAFIELLTTAAPSAVRLTAVTPITSTNGVGGMVVDVSAGPIGLRVGGPNDLRTRVALFAPAAAADGAPVSWVALLMSATSDRWARYEALFEQVLESAAVYEVQPGSAAQEGNVVLRGALEGERDEVSSGLERGVSDVWTFTTSDTRYASISLQPHEPHLDLSLRLLGPDRQPVAQVENGFAGVTETATDVRLLQPGLYVIEVSEYARRSGRYSLSLTLSGQPQHSDGGAIAFGQVLQSELAGGGRHYWVFPGVARQRISIVLEPDARTFDAILELHGPDGGQLVALDEGFSGDPELISGYELPASGGYTIVVHSFSAQGGPYTLSLDEDTGQIANFHDAGELGYGDTRPETLQRGEAHAWFLQGKAGDHILIRATPLDAHLDLDLLLLDDAIERVAAADAFIAGESETIELTLGADGQYIVLVRDFNGDAGEYEIALGAAPAATPETAGSLSFGDAIISAVRPGAAAAWSFNGEAGDVITIEARAADARGDIVLQLRDPDGGTVLEVDEHSAGGDEAIRSYVLPLAGQWHIVLRDYFGGAAGYRLSLERAAR